MLLGIVLGLVAAVLWGSGDVLINRLTQFVGTSKALVLTQVMSLGFWLLYGLGPGMLNWMRGGDWTGVPTDVGVGPWQLAAVCGVFHVVGLTLTYRAFEVGTLSIVSPIASSFAIVTAITALIAGERPGVVPLSGALMLVAGVVIVTRASSGGGSATLRGVPEALGSAIGFGVMFWLVQEPERALGMPWALFVLKLMAAGTAVVAVAAARRRASAPDAVEAAPRWKIWSFAAAVAVSDSFAWIALIEGFKTKAYVTVVTALASLFSVVTVILAAALLRERLNRTQWSGIVAIFLGIAFVSLPVEAWWSLLRK